MREVLQKLTEASDDQLDAVVCNRLKILLEVGYTASDIKQVLDDCAYSALASTFVMKVLDVIWHDLKKQEGND